jgi:hypothetical protein
VRGEPIVRSEVELRPSTAFNFESTSNITNPINNSLLDDFIDHLILQTDFALSDDIHSVARGNQSLEVICDEALSARISLRM